MTSINGGRKELNSHTQKQSWVSLQPLSSPLHLVLAKPPPAADPAKRWSGKGFFLRFGFYCYHGSYGQSHLQESSKSQQAKSPHGARAGEGSAGPAARGERRVFRAASAGLIAGCSGDDGQRSWERSCHPSVSPPQTLSSCPGISLRCKKRREPFLWDVTALAAALEQELRVERCPEMWSNS